MTISADSAIAADTPINGTNPVITKQDMIGAKMDDMTRMELARDMGVTRGAVTSAEKRWGIYLDKGVKRDTFTLIKREAMSMKPGDAVEFLLAALEDLLGFPEELQLWPGVKLTQKQRAFLALLYRHEGRVLSRDQILAALYPHPDKMPIAKTIDVMASHVRKKTRAHGVRIVNEFGVGYKLVRRRGVVFPWEVKG